MFINYGMIYAVLHKCNFFFLTSKLTLKKYANPIQQALSYWQ